MTQPMCEHTNPPGSAFCGTCGSQLPHRRCRCGAASPQEVKFCRNCGAPLALAAQGQDAGSQAANRGKYDLSEFLGQESEPPKRPVPTRKKLSQEDIRHLLKKRKAEDL